MSNRHERRALAARARKTQAGLDQLGVAARKLKELEALPDALKDVQAILSGVNEARFALSMAIQDIGDLGRKYARLEHQLMALAVAAGVSATVAQAGAEYDAAHPEEQEEAPVEPTPET